MKKILITGARSYVGTSFERYLAENFSSDYVVDTVDMLDGQWREKSFKGYDAVFHVAGIPHSDNGKISQEKEKLYYDVNTELALSVAQKAKADSVKQFVFMSSAIVYGNSAKIGRSKMITKTTAVSPANAYGNSKVKAEDGLRAIQDDQFRVCILRPPMIYGKGCKGNYPSLSHIARHFRFFPYVKNERSMIYIGNFVEFVRLMIENSESGVFFPQNPCYVNTSEMVKAIATLHGKKVHLIKGVSWALKIVGLFDKRVNKAFGNLTYDLSMSEYKEEYRKYDLQKSIELSEK